MDRAYEDDQTLRTAQLLKFSPVVPPKSNRVNPWEHDTVLYVYTNTIECRLIQKKPLCFFLLL